MRGKLAAVSAVDSHEKVRDLLQQEATLRLRLERGEAELTRLENEIANAQQNAHSEDIRMVSEQHEEQRKRNVVLAQIADLDDVIAGRKLPPSEPLRPDDTAQSAYRRQIDYYIQLRACVMEENGLTEADLPQASVANPTGI